MSPISPIRIIGIGSPFGDDGIGWLAIEAIEHSGMLSRFPAEAVATFRCSGPATDLLPMLSGARAALLIDGMKSGAPPGALRKIDAGELRAGPGKISSHGLSVAENLALGRVLGMLPETLMIYGIEIGEAGGEPGLSSNLRGAIPLLLGEIDAALRTLVQESG